MYTSILGKTLEQALAISREIGDRPGEGWTLNNLGRAYAVLGQQVKAQESYEAALRIRHEIGDRRGEGATLSNLAVLLTSMREYTRAKECYDKALVFRREVGDRNGEGKTLNYMGLFYVQQGQHMQALPYFKQSFKIHRELSHAKRQGEVLLNLALSYSHLSRTDAALACLLLAEENFVQAQQAGSDVQDHLEQVEKAKDDLQQQVGVAQWPQMLPNVELNYIKMVEELLEQEEP